MTKFLLYVARQNRGVIIPFLQFAKQSYERNAFVKQTLWKKHLFNKKSPHIGGDIQAIA